jgi:hypothetical protein
MARKTTFSVEGRETPNGQHFYYMRINEEVIGTYEAVKNGWLPAGGRKPRASQHDAQLWVLNRYIGAQARKIERAAYWQKQLAEEQE